MLSIRRFMFAILIASSGFTAVAGRVAAEEAKALGQPSNQIGLVHDHDPVKYAGHVLYFVEGKLVGHDRLTQTWSIVPQGRGV